MIITPLVDGEEPATVADGRGVILRCKVPSGESLFLVFTDAGELRALVSRLNVARWQLENPGMARITVTPPA